METVIEVKYRAIAWSDYQGGAGKNFEDRIIFSLDESATIVEITDKVFDYLGKESAKTFIGEVNLISVELVGLAE